MKNLAITLACIALTFALVGCSSGEPSHPVVNPQPAHSAEPTKTPEVDPSTAIVAVTLPPLFSAEKTDDENRNGTQYHTYKCRFFQNEVPLFLMLSRRYMNACPWQIGNK